MKGEPDIIFDPNLFMPFGAKVIVMIRPGVRTGPKNHSQRAAYPGIFVGYGETTNQGGAYRVFDLENRKIRTVSMNDCTIKEDEFPMRTRKEWRDRSFDLPVDFEPTINSFLNDAEWEKFGFDESQELEVAGRLRSENPAKWKDVFADDKDVDASAVQAPDLLDEDVLGQTDAANEDLDSRGEDTTIDLGGVTDEVIIDSQDSLPPKSPQEPMPPLEVDGTAIKLDSDTNNGIKI